MPRNGSVSVMNIPNIVLRSVFKYRQNGLNLCLINVGSICAKSKIDQFRRVFETSNAHLIIVTETWLKIYRSNASIAVLGTIGVHVEVVVLLCTSKKA